MSRMWSVQLKDLASGETIITSGGKVYVAQAGGAAKQALVDKNGAAASNPLTPTRGKIEFYVADETVTKVDLYIQAPGGQFIVRKGMTCSGPNEIGIDTSRLEQTLVIPFSITDQAANAETNTGFVVPDGLMLPQPMVDVKTADSGMTINVGTLSTDSGDADGYVAAASLASIAVVKASLANGAVTMGALLKVQDSANAGDAVPEGNVSMIGKAITTTLSSSSDTAEGFVHLPYRLAA